MPVERREQVTRVETDMGQLATGGTRGFRRKAAAFTEWHEPDKSRAYVRFCEGLGVRFPGATGRSAGDRRPYADQIILCGRPHGMTSLHVMNRGALVVKSPMDRL